MVVLVTGGNGQLGQALQFVASGHPDIQFHFCSSSEADVTNKEKLSDIFKKFKPDFCVNAAAYTAVDKSESEPEKAASINVDGAKNLAEVCNQFDATLIHISTDFVFDGLQTTPYTETDATNPQGVYGRTKLLGEQAILETGNKFYIVRTAWLYSQFGANFMKTMLRLASERDSISVVNDQIGTPTNTVDLAEAIVKMILSGNQPNGVYHFSNEGAASWYDFAKEIFKINSVEIDLQPIPTSQFPTPAKRPAYSVLDKSKIKKAFGLEISDWQTALRKTT